jgi:hypothetical protein
MATTLATSLKMLRLGECHGAICKTFARTAMQCIVTIVLWKCDIIDGIVNLCNCRIDHRWLRIWYALVHM